MKTTILILFLLVTAGVMAQETKTVTIETITIGTQSWMTENLNVGTMGVDKDCYLNKEANCDTYGGLYNWERLNLTSEGGQGICPNGFHIPTKAEWRELDAFLGGYILEDGRSAQDMTTKAGTKLREQGTVHWYRNKLIGGGSDDYGFTALPGGYKYGDTRYVMMKANAYFWTSTTEPGHDNWAWYRGIGFSYPYMTENMVFKTDEPPYLHSELSVRCIQNQ